MDPMVSARVPAELRDQVNTMLRAQGSSPTALINGAYREYRETGRLPGTMEKRAAGMRTLSKAQREELAASIRATTHPVPEGYFAGRDYDDILEQNMRAEYETPA